MKRKVLGILVVLVVSLTLVLLRADSEVHAAGLTRVQGPCSATSSGTSVFVNLIRPALNDGLVAVITSGSSSGIKTVSSLSEDNVNWYLVVSSSAYDSYNDYVDVEIWAANVSTSSAGITITASFSGSCEEGNTITVCEYSGLYPFVSKVTATNGGTSATPDTGTTASTSAQLDVGGLVRYACAFSNPTNGFTMPVMLYTTTTYAHGAAYLERQLPQTGTVDCNVTSYIGNAPWAGAMATFGSLSEETATAGTPLWAQWLLWTSIALGITTAIFACTTFYYWNKGYTRKEDKSVVSKPLSIASSEINQSNPPIPKEAVCPSCGKNMIFTQQYQRWYCPNEKKYI